MNEGVAGMAGGLVQFRVLRNLVILSYANLGALWEKVALLLFRTVNLNSFVPTKGLCESRTF